MGTNVRASISSKNPYYISKHRYYELRHFCLQYPEWKQEYKQIVIEPHAVRLKTDSARSSYISETVPQQAIRRIELQRKMERVEDAAYRTDPELSDYILLGVTKGVSYEYLKMNKDIPCCREVYYIRYRKFFWILSHSD